MSIIGLLERRSRKVGEYLLKSQRRSDQLQQHSMQSIVCYSVWVVSVTRIFRNRVKKRGFDTYNVARNLAIMQALATFTRQRDIFVPEDVIDQLIHSWLFELAPGASLAAESGGSLYFLLQEIPNV